MRTSKIRLFNTFDDLLIFSFSTFVKIAFLRESDLRLESKSRISHVSFRKVVKFGTFDKPTVRESEGI